MVDLRGPLINRITFSATFVMMVLLAPSVYAQQGGASPPRSVEELAERYRRAHAVRDIEAIKRLFYWGASTDRNRTLVASFIAQDVAHAISGVSVKPVGPNDLTEYTQNGIRYRTTLPATAKLVVDFRPRTEGGVKYNAEQTSYFIGTRNGEYWLVTAEPSPR